MRERKTSRILNNQNYFLGLSYTDISGVGVLLLILIILFKAFAITNMIWALLIVILFLIALIPIRMSFRRKILRDSVLYFFKNGVCYVSKNNRKH